MTLALAALVVAALNPVAPVTSLSLGQKKIEIIKGGGKKVRPAPSVEIAPQPIQDNSGVNQAKAAELDRKSAELDARNKELSQKEAALEEKQQAQAEQEKAKAEKQKALQKKIEKIGQQNEEAFGAATDALAGD
jgi:DNA repair exonuclease SbcCD ATPase subunit